MKKTEFVSICRAVDHGAEKNVEHHLTHGKAKVIACENSNLKVESGGRVRSWAMQNCEETS